MRETRQLTLNVRVLPFTLYPFTFTLYPCFKHNSRSTLLELIVQYVICYCPQHFTCHIFPEKIIFEGNKVLGRLAKCHEYRNLRSCKNFQGLGKLLNLTYGPYFAVFLGTHSWKCREIGYFSYFCKKKCILWIL